MITQRIVTVFCASLVSLPAAAMPAFADKDAVAKLYELRLAPDICRWTDIGDAGRLDATIDEIERRLAMTPSDASALKKVARADLQSDPAKCDRGGPIGQMYDDAVQFDD
jgi:hypothetical protein